MKKILPLLGGIVITGITTTSVVSCIAPQYAYGSAGERVIVATDGGRIDDHSFNQDAYLGMKNFVKENYGINGKNNYVEAPEGSHTATVSGYRLAKLKKADAVVLPGFAHMSTMREAADLFGNKTIVLVDGVPPDNSTRYNHTISILFNSQLAGMQAGFDAAYWATTKNNQGMMNGDVNGDNRITFGTFAGASNKYGVDNYNWGLLLGMELFNQYYQDKEPDRKVYLANTKDNTIASVKVDNTTSTDWWTNSFQLGAATKTGIVANLIDKQKADIIFPVAGPQIQDVLTYQPRDKSFQRLPYIIGVDVDQAVIYDNPVNHGRFITSAIKNVHSATKVALEHASSLRAKNQADDLPYRTDGEVWDGTAPERYLNWSVDLIDQNNEGKYQLKQHYLQLFEGENSRDPDKAGAKQVDPTENNLINFVNTAFAKLGETAPDYLNGKIITTLAQQIIEKNLLVVYSPEK